MPLRMYSVCSQRMVNAVSLRDTVKLLAGLRVAVAGGHGIPVDHLPPRVDVVGPLILVTQVIGVFPDVDAEERRLASHQRTVLVGAVHDLEFAVGQHQPGPATAESA